MKVETLFNALEKWGIGNKDKTFVQKIRYFRKQGEP